MKLASQCVQLLFLLHSVSGFSPLHMSVRQDSCRKMSQKDDTFVQDCRAFGVAASIFAFSFVNPPATAATPMDQANGHVFSSSIQLSETIKTMDFSLPSSYDSISDAKASGTDELSSEVNVITGAKVKKVKKAKVESTDDGFNLLGKQLSPEEKAELAAQKRAEREAAAAEKAAEEAAKQAEREALAAAKQAEREALDAQRAAERAVAEAEKAAQREAAKEAKAKAEEVRAEKEAQKAAQSKFAGADFVDMGLPSYGDSTSSKSRGVFSL